MPPARQSFDSSSALGHRSVPFIGAFSAEVGSPHSQFIDLSYVSSCVGNIPCLRDRDSVGSKTTTFVRPYILTEDMVPEKWRPTRDRVADGDWYIVFAIFGGILFLGVLGVWMVSWFKCYRSGECFWNCDSGCCWGIFVRKEEIKEIDELGSSSSSSGSFVSTIGTVRTITTMEYGIIRPEDEEVATYTSDDTEY